MGAYSSGLTPEKLSGLHRNADAGRIDQTMRLYSDVMSKDLHLGGILDKRKGAVAGCTWEIIPGTDDTQGEKDTDLIRELFRVIPNFDDMIRSLMEAVPYGFSFLEVMWATDGKWIYVESVDDILPHRFIFQDNKDWKLLSYPRLITDDNLNGIELPKDKFLFHRFQPKGGYVVRSGLMRALVWWWMFKSYSIKDWLAFMEIYGQGFRIGRYDEGASPGDRDVLEEAVKNMATDFSAVISKSTEIEVKYPQITSAVASYENFGHFANAEMSKRVLGQTLTTEQGEKGARALGQVHKEVEQDVLEYDARCIMGTIQKGLVVPLVDWNHGQRDKYPKFMIHYQPEEDLLQLAQKDKILIVDMGVEVPVSYIRSKHGIPEPEGDEPVVGRLINPTKEDKDKGKAAQFQEEAAVEDIIGLVGMVKPLLMELSEDKIRDILGNVGRQITAFEGDLREAVANRVITEVNGILRGQIGTREALDGLTSFFSQDRFRDPDSGEYTMDPRARAELYIRNEMKQVHRDAALESAKETYPNQKLYVFSRGPRDARTEADSMAIEELTNWEYGGIPMPVDQYWSHPTVQAAHRPNDRGRDVLWPLRRFPPEVQKAIVTKWGK